MYTFRTLKRKLKEIDPAFCFSKNRGKGSERMIYHPNINGREESYPIKCHGEGDEISKGTLGAIKRRFNLKGKL